MINAFILLTKQMDGVEHCLEFVNQGVPDLIARIQRKRGLQFQRPVFI
jgi:hypothetical protein